ncbi:hypothetical protein ACB094_06G009200 [Castanea mollissima]
MKQKIVIKVQMAGDKCRAKAMKIAAIADGVILVAVEGADKDQLVVIGEGVDSAKLTCSLRKKLCYVTLLGVEEVRKGVVGPAHLIVHSMGFYQEFYFK